MSTGGVALPFPPGQADRAPGDRKLLVEMFQRFTPSQGWVTFGLLVTILLVVGDSVRNADWVDTPGLNGQLLSGAFAGLILAKARAPAFLLHLVGLASGFVVVVLQTSVLADGQSLVGQVQDMWNRLTTWFDAATSGGISTDLLPFSLAMLTAAWLLGYIGSWFTFRSNNVWPGMVLAAIAILTNLSFLPEGLSIRFFLFIFLAMLLVVRIRVVQRQEEWGKVGIGFSTVSGWITIHSAIWFSAIVLIVAALLPLNVVTQGTLKDAWNTARSPVAYLEDEFTRLFGALPSRKDLAGRVFGSALPFLGKISFSGEVVIWADTDYPSYWLSRTYSEYSSKGWFTGKTESLDVGPSALPPPRGDSLKRVPAEQTVQMTFDTSNLFAGGSIDWISRNAVAETLAPKQFEINMKDESNDHLLPEEIRQVADDLRHKLAPRADEFIESSVSRLLPDDLVLIAYSPAVEIRHLSVLDSVTIQRKEPITPEIVSWKLDDGIQEGQAYSMVSYVSTASNDDLREADTEYHGFITDHYVQLPPSLPQRVRDLAEELTKDADNPLDKALAIQNYLRGPDFTYSKKIEIPPEGSDGVDHFLFETQTGYSDYFASSMTVMMRAVGVPARLAVGYAPGEVHIESGRTFVKDSDSHGWAQVYFPKYGWIDFEPTVAWGPPSRRLHSEEDPGTAASPESSSILISPEDIFPPFEGSGSERPEGQADGGSSLISAAVFIRIAIALGALAALYVVLLVAWNIGLLKATPVERAYAKMGRLGALAGFRRRPYQTPTEYAVVIGSAIPAIGSAARRIASAFAGDRYGGRKVAQEDRAEMDQAWRGIRGGLAARALRRLIPIW